MSDLSITTNCDKIHKKVFCDFGTAATKLKVLLTNWYQSGLLEHLSQSVQLFLQI
jgi:hypothetical protein